MNSPLESPACLSLGLAPVSAAVRPAGGPASARPV